MNSRLICMQEELWDLTSPVVMGILNITPDSFYDGGSYLNRETALLRCKKILAEGGKIIDVGAFSSRPGAKAVSEVEEAERLFPILEAIREEYPQAVISVDTYRAKIAERAVKEFHVDMINDISGGMLDEDMIPLMGELQKPYIMMHMRGKPENMQNNVEYDNLTKEITLFFSEQLHKCVKHKVLDVIIDPGFGFSKKVEQNYELLNNLEYLQVLDKPVLVGISRKSMISRALNIDVENTLNGTTVLNSIALVNGANILRVHDVKEAMECIKLVKKTVNS